MVASATTLGSGITLAVGEEDAFWTLTSQLLGDPGTGRVKGGWGVRTRDVIAAKDIDGLCALYEHRVVRHLDGSVAGIAGYDHAWRDLGPLLWALSHVAVPGSWLCVDDAGTDGCRLFVLEGPDQVAETQGRSSFSVAMDLDEDLPVEIWPADDAFYAAATAAEVQEAYTAAGGVPLVPAAAFEDLRRITA